MNNIDKVRTLFLDGTVKQATNSEIGKLTGITPHSQVYQLTDKLVNEGFLIYIQAGRSKLFSLAGDRKSYCYPRREKSLSSNQSQNQKSKNDLSIKGIELLIDIGFEKVGDWKIVDKSIDYKLSKYASSNRILYAFIADKQVLYIGKTIRTLNQRMYGYKNPGPTQKTNIKNNQKIQLLLNQGKKIDIYVFVPKENLYFKGVKVNLAAGLEDQLIEFVQPPWNSTGK